jgi:disulfide oxidoreductase YuzD
MKPNSCACYGSNDIHECYCLKNNNMKQTAVEWLQEAISKKVNNELGPYFIDLFDNAKAMEKEQIIDAYSNNGWNDEDQRANAEQYYNEQFKQDNL